MVNLVLRAGAAILLYCALGWNTCFGVESNSSLIAQNQAIEAALLLQGFENVRTGYTSDEKSLYIEYENRVYRNDLYAAGLVAGIASRQCLDSTSIALVPLKENVPICDIVFNVEDYKKLIDGTLDKDLFAARLTVKTHTSDADSIFSSVKKKSYRKIDLYVDPGLNYQLGNLDDPYKFYVAINPEISTTLWKGFVLSGRYKIPIIDEIGNYQIGRYKSTSSLSRLTATQFLNLPRNGFAVVNIGLFEPDRWGGSSEIAWYLFDQRVLIGSKLDYTGFMLYRNGVLSYSKLGEFTNRTYCYYFFSGIDVSFGIGFAKYVLGDQGFFCELNRVFHEVEIGFFAAKTNEDDHGGFNIRIPIFPNRRMKPGLVRISPPLYYNFSYQSTTKPEILGGITETGVKVKTGHELRDFIGNMSAMYIKNNIEIWKKVNLKINQLK
jgi:hypothetical protein